MTSSRKKNVMQSSGGSFYSPWMVVKSYQMNRKVQLKWWGNLSTLSVSSGQKKVDKDGLWRRLKR